MKLNLGCGRDIRPKEEGWINVDKVKREGVDVKWDLNEYPYPFKNNSTELIIAYDIIEHLDKPYEFIKECYRICKNKAKIKIITAHFSSRNSWADITHVRPFSIRSFKHLNIETKKRGDTSLYDTKEKFKVKGKMEFGKLHRLMGIQFIMNKIPDIYENYLVYFFPARSLLFELTPMKK